MAAITTFEKNTEARREGPAARKLTCEARSIAAMGHSYGNSAPDLQITDLDFHSVYIRRFR